MAGAVDQLYKRSSKQITSLVFNNTKYPPFDCTLVIDITMLVVTSVFVVAGLTFVTCSPWLLTLPWLSSLPRLQIAYGNLIYHLHQGYQCECA